MLDKFAFLAMVDWKQLDAITNTLDKAIHEAYVKHYREGRELVHAALNTGTANFSSEDLIKLDNFTASIFEGLFLYSGD